MVKAVGNHGGQETRHGTAKMLWGQNGEDRRPGLGLYEGWGHCKEALLAIQGQLNWEGYI